MSLQTKEIKDMNSKRKILNKIVILFCTLFSLTSCTSGTKIYKGIEISYKNVLDDIYYPKTSLIVHINPSCKDFNIEYFQVMYNEIRNEWSGITKIEKGINVKLIDNEGILYLSEGSYILFEDKCPLH